MRLTGKPLNPTIRECPTDLHAKVAATKSIKIVVPVHKVHLLLQK